MMHRSKSTSRLWLFLGFVLVCLSFGILCHRMTVWPHRVMPLLGFALGSGLLYGLIQVGRTYYHLNRLAPHTQGNDRIKLDSLLDELGIHRDRVQIISSPFSQAFCYGFLRPQICVSTTLLESLNTKQLRAVLLHEEYHRRCYHPLLLLGLDTLRAAFFFLPLVHEWVTIQKTTLELDADQYAVAYVGKQSLASALHTLLATQSTPLQGIVAGMSVTEARITCLLGEPLRLSYTPKSIFISSFILLLVCMI